MQEMVPPDLLGYSRLNNLKYISYNIVIGAFRDLNFQFMAK